MTANTFSPLRTLGDGDSDFVNRFKGQRYINTLTAPAHGNGKVVSLFTGAGGMELGLEMAGFEVAVCVEIDADCRATLRHNRPEWVLFEKDNGRIAGDVRSISAKELLAASGLKTGEAALVTGGVPCQPFSNIGKKEGMDAQNGDLFLEFVRIIKGIRPKAFIFENVSGITQSRHNQVINYMRSQFDGLGYEVSFDILNAADYGVPQQRKRFIMIGTLNVTPAFPLPTHSRSPKDWDKFQSQFHQPLNVRPLEWVTSGEALKSVTKELCERPDCIGMNHSADMRAKMSLVKQGRNFKSLPPHLLPDCWRSGKHQGQDTFGRIEADRPAPTIRTAAYNPTKGKYIHPFEDRGLNTMEMAVFQTFPPEWEFRTANGKMTILSVGRQIGNAVPALLAEAIGLALASGLQAQARISSKIARSSAPLFAQKSISTAA